MWKIARVLNFPSQASHWNMCLRFCFLPFSLSVLVYKHCWKASLEGCEYWEKEQGGKRPLFLLSFFLGIFSLSWHQSIFGITLKYLQFLLLDFYEKTRALQNISCINILLFIVYGKNGYGYLDSCIIEQLRNQMYTVRFLYSLFWMFFMYFFPPRQYFCTNNLSYR